MRRRTALVTTIAAAATLSGVGGFAFSGAEAACVSTPGAGGPQTAPRRVCVPSTDAPCSDCAPGPRVPELPEYDGGLVREAHGRVMVESNKAIYRVNNTLAKAWEDAGQILGGSGPIGPIPLPKRPEVPYLPGGGAP